MLALLIPIFILIIPMISLLNENTELVWIILRGLILTLTVISASLSVFSMYKLHKGIPLPKSSPTLKDAVASKAIVEVFYMIVSCIGLVITMITLVILSKL